MKTMNRLKDMSFNTLSSIFEDVGSALPTVLAAILALVLGWVLSKVIRYILKRVLKIAKIGSVSDKLNEVKLFGDGVAKINLEKIILTFVKWVILLVTIIIVADITKLTVISNEIANILRYLPVLFSSMLIFVIGLYASNLIKKMLLKVFESMRLRGSKLVSGVVFYVLVIFVSITALNNAGIDTEVITNNFTMVLGAFLLAFALAFGFGSREVVADLLKTFYARKNYSIGDKIKLNEIEGEIQSIDSLFVTLKIGANQRIVLPIKELVENRIELK